MGFLVFWLVMGGVVAIVADSKGYNWFLWLLYGAVIWPIALTHILVIGPAERTGPAPVGPVHDLPPRKPRPGGQTIQVGQAPAMKACPMCAEDVRAAALVCRFCGHKFEPVVPQPVPEPASITVVSTAPSATLRTAAGSRDGVRHGWTTISKRDIGLRYLDGGNPPAIERIVTIGSVELQDHQLTRLRGYCHLRNEPREFLVTRIQSAFVPVTGEAVDDIGAYFT